MTFVPWEGKGEVDIKPRDTIFSMAMSIKAILPMTSSSGTRTRIVLMI
jgi:hypothetical protein